MTSLINLRYTLFMRWLLFNLGLHRRETTVNAKNLAGNPRALLRQKYGREGRDIVGLSEASEWMERSRKGRGGLVRCDLLTHRGLHEPRSDTVHP